MDEMSKRFTEDLTGKPYEAGDLSIEIDKRVKSSVAAFCGKDEYEFGGTSYLLYMVDIVHYAVACI